MAPSTAGATGWYRGRVKAVPSGDSLVVMAMTSNRPGPPPEKTITLASLIAPRLARRGGFDEHFAWDSREFLRQLCIGKEVTFRVEYTVPNIGREFGSVFLGDKNVASLVVSAGWAKVKEQNQKAEATPFLTELLRLEEQAKQQGLGRWSKVPGAGEASVRDLPPSSIGDSSGLDLKAFADENKGKPMEAIVEQVRDGSTLRVNLLPDFHFVQVFVAGVQSPSMGRKAPASETASTKEVAAVQTNGAASAVPSAPATDAQRAAASVAVTTEVAPEPFAVEAKYFTETRVLNRDVRIVLEGTDSKNNLVGSVYYPDGETAKDLAQELVENALAKCVQWSLQTLDGDARERLKSAELQAKKSRLRIWTNYVPQERKSKAIRNQNFTGKVVEVVSGDCIIVADDSVPVGSPSVDRRINLSSVRCPRFLENKEGKEGEGKDSRNQKPDPYWGEAKEFLRTRLIGQQVSVQMEYSRNVEVNGVADARIMDFGSVFLLAPMKGDEGVTSSEPPSTAGSQPAGVNVAEMVLARGLASVVQHRDFEERSSHYIALLAAEDRAKAQKKGKHSGKNPPVSHINDLTLQSTKPKSVKNHLSSLQRSRRVAAIVEYVLSGHRYKLLIPKENCRIFFSLSGVRCPAKGQPYANEAMAVMRRKLMQRDVEIEVEAVDSIGTFLGTLWESGRNVSITLLGAGLASLRPFSIDRLHDSHLLEQAEQSAKNQKLKIWEKGEEAVSNGSAAAAVQNKKKEVLKVVVTEVLDGGKFYIQKVDDKGVASIQQQLASLTIPDAPIIIDTFKPKKGHIVLAQFSVDNSWNRAMIVSGPREGNISPKSMFEVLYIDYGNKEEVPYTKLRPLDPSLADAPSLAQLCSLAYVKVPGLENDYGTDAAQFLSELTMGSSGEFKAIVEFTDSPGGKAKVHGMGTTLFVTLVPDDSETSINATMVQEGLARPERRKNPNVEWREWREAVDGLENLRDEAKKGRRGIWEHGDPASDDEEAPQPQVAGKKTGGRR